MFNYLFISLLHTYDSHQMSYADWNFKSLPNTCEVYVFTRRSHEVNWIYGKFKDTLHSKSALEFLSLP